MDNLENQNNAQDSYKTGSTKPPKSRGGLVAGLLIAVILLAGVSSILGVMNIHLFRMLEADRGNLVAFLENMPTEAKTAGDDSGSPMPGLTVSDISELDQRYFGLPAGVLITAAETQGCAAKAGLAAGDIIMSINGSEVLSVQELEQALKDCQEGDRIEVTFYRHRTGKQHKTTVILENANG